METKHTKGEWVFSKNTNAIFQKENEQKQPKLIAKIVFDKAVNPLCAGAFKTNEESEANAKLIAAAPELLEALMALLKEVENTNSDLTPTHVKAIRAIKKATE